MQIQYSPLTQLVTLTKSNHQITLNESQTRELILKLQFIDFDSDSIENQTFISLSSNRLESMDESYV